jgi:glycolate oxidase FAD binding subunit
MRGFPLDTSDVARSVAEAVVERRPLRVCAGASKIGWSTHRSDVSVLDISRLRGVIDYQPTELILTAQAATPLHEIEALLDAHQQMLAFEPPDWRAVLGTSDRYQTLGGIMACNLSGPRRVTAGAARDHFLGTHAVSGRGEIFKAGGKVVKNVTGYDLCKLLAGSYGTLAVMTELTVKVMPRPEVSRSIVRFGLSDAEGSRYMMDALKSAHEVSAAAHLPANVAPQGSSLTALRLEGSTASVEARQAALRRELNGGLMEESESKRLWTSIRDLQPLARGEGDVWRLSIPPSCASAVSTAISKRLTCRWFYDWGGALMWLRAEGRSDDGGADAIRAAVREIGHAFRIRASSTDRYEALPAQLSELNARVKHAFDPAGILNPG